MESCGIKQLRSYLPRTIFLVWKYSCSRNTPWVVLIHCDILQESLLMSIFPKDVAHMVVQDLQTKPSLTESKCGFRSLYVNRFDNVR